MKIVVESTIPSGGYQKKQHCFSTKSSINFNIKNKGYR